MTMLIAAPANGARCVASCADVCLQAWKFFSERIAIEEQQLQKFFGHAYIQYAEKTPTLIPFIK